MSGKYSCVQEWEGGTLLACGLVANHAGYLLLACEVEVSQHGGRDQPEACLQATVWSTDRKATSVRKRDVGWDLEKGTAALVTSFLSSGSVVENFRQSFRDYPQFSPWESV